MALMKHFWSYDKVKRMDKNRKRWHFVSHSIFDDERKYEERPFELYLRDEERSIFGVMRFKRHKDNPYHDWNTMINKIMNNSEFRSSLIDSETKAIWNKNWK